MAGKENSMCRFVQDLTQECFPLKSVHFIDIDKSIEPNLAKLSLRLDRKRPTSELTIPQAKKGKKEESVKEPPKFSYLPVPKSIFSNLKTSNINSNKSTSTTSKNEEASSSRNKPIPGRGMCLITGTIEFIIKINKEYPDILAIFEAYGKVIKIVKGKHSCEQLIFLRGAAGPVLKTVYYEVDTELPNLQNGNYVCCIGRFNTNKKFQIFKLTHLPFQPMEEVLTRLQNICSFTLNKMNKK